MNKNITLDRVEFGITVRILLLVGMITGSVLTRALDLTWLGISMYVGTTTLFFVFFSIRDAKKPL